MSEEETKERRKDSAKIGEQLERLLKTLDEIEVESNMVENESRRMILKTNLKCIMEKNQRADQKLKEIKNEIVQRLKEEQTAKDKDIMERKKVINICEKIKQKVGTTENQTSLNEMENSIVSQYDEESFAEDEQSPEVWIAVEDDVFFCPDLPAAPLTTGPP